jgi:hypothetical protein
MGWGAMSGYVVRNEDMKSNYAHTAMLVWHIRLSVKRLHNMMARDLC